MAVWEWIRFLIGGGLLLAGLVTFVIEMIGVFRFRYVLNRMHAAAIGDTLGIGFALSGLIVISGFNFTSLKLFLVIVFLWFSSPVSSHLIARLEVTTNEDSGKHYRRKRLEASEKRQKEKESGETLGENGDGKMSKEEEGRRMPKEREDGKTSEQNRAERVPFDNKDVGRCVE